MYQTHEKAHITLETINIDNKFDFISKRLHIYSEPINPKMRPLRGRTRVNTCLL